MHTSGRWNLSNLAGILAHAGFFNRGGGQSFTFLYFSFLFPLTHFLPTPLPTLTLAIYVVDYVMQTVIKVTSLKRQLKDVISTLGWTRTTLRLSSYIKYQKLEVKRLQDLRLRPDIFFCNIKIDFVHHQKVKTMIARGRGRWSVMKCFHSLVWFCY